MPDLTKEQKYIILVLIGIIVSGLAYGVWGRFFKEADAGIIIPEASAPMPRSFTPAPEYAVVHITGAVRNKGVFRIRKPSRLIDLVRAAGGLAEDADLDGINLAEEISDGAKINIPYRTLVHGLPPSVSGNAGPISEHTAGGLVNINIADLNELKKIKGVGDTTAQRILEYRSQNGRFSKAEDLMKVKGIGKGTFEKIKGQVRVN